MPHDDRIDKILEVVSELKTEMAVVKSETKAQTKVLVHTCRKAEKIEKEQNAHGQKDETRFTSLETSAKWLKGIGALFVGATGLKHLFEWFSAWGVK